jgi:hypothetical protein
MKLAVLTPDEKLLAVTKPPLKKIKRVVLNPDDWLVVCAGFEHRARAVLKSAASSRIPFTVALITYDPFFPENRISDIRKICQQANIRIVELQYDRQAPAGFGGILVDALSGCSGRIFVDVSGMSRLLVVQILVALGKRPEGFLNCLIAYAEARHYPPNKTEVRGELAKSKFDPSSSIFFLSSGIFEVTLVPELSSSVLAGVHTRLVTFPSLDAHHLTALRAELQPSRLTLIEGVPPGTHNFWRTNAIAEVNCLEQIHNAERFRVSTLDYKKTLDCLLKIYTNHGSHERLLISPIGSKMQAVAVGIFRSFVEDVQIVYPTPRGFRMPKKYTIGTGQMHLLDLSRFRNVG